MSSRSRCTFLVVLTGIFLGQTWMVYVDAAGRQLPPLSPQAMRGRMLWHRHNCQSCHQLYGFGGFLGPDLTNLAQRLQSHAADAGGEARVEVNRMALVGRLDTVLTTGSERMPAFHLAPPEREDLAAFFEELSRTGTGQIQISAGLPPRELFEGLLGAATALAELDTDPLRGPSTDPLTDTLTDTLTDPLKDPLTDPSKDALTDLVQRGRQVAAERGCIDCHMPNAKSSFRATCLTRIHATVDAERVATVLRQGIPEKGMPSFALDAAEIEAVSAFLGFLGRHGTEIRQGFEAAERGSSGSLLDLPWFEYQ